MVLLAWPLVFWYVSSTGTFLSFFLSPCSSFLYTPCILMGALLSFVQYIAFTDQKKNNNNVADALSSKELFPSHLLTEWSHSIIMFLYVLLNLSDC